MKALVSRRTGLVGAVSGQRGIALFAGIAVLVLAWPAAAAGDHVQTSATVSARITEIGDDDVWKVEITWNAGCTGVPDGTAWYDGHLYMIDVATGERIYVGGVVNTSGQRIVSETREWAVAAQRRTRTLFPELTIGCFQNFPLHGGPDVVVTGSSVTVPRRFGDGGDRGAGGRGGRGGGGTDPTEPLSSGGCLLALLGTNGPDMLGGGAGDEVIVAFSARDRLNGREGDDCLIGGSGGDRLVGGEGRDRLTGGGGADALVDRDGANAFEAGSGADFVDARNGAPEPVRCGPGFDRARVDRSDHVRGCERLSET